MIPTAFDEENLLLDTPPSLNPDICSPLSVCITHTLDGIPVVISCWKVTKEELELIAKTGRVWLTVMGGMMPPVQITGMKPFEEDEV